MNPKTEEASQVIVARKQRRRSRERPRITAARLVDVNRTECRRYRHEDRSIPAGRGHRRIPNGPVGSRKKAQDARCSAGKIEHACRSAARKIKRGCRSNLQEDRYRSREQWFYRCNDIKATRASPESIAACGRLPRLPTARPRHLLRATRKPSETDIKTGCINRAAIRDD